MKKGFTLIELLAVIVILAIIALIVTPVISNIINNAKEQANMRSVEGHIGNINNLLTKNLLDKKETEGKYSFSELDFNEYPSSDPIRCSSYKVTKNKVEKATNCEIDGKYYCYEGNKTVLCGGKIRKAPTEPDIFLLDLNDTTLIESGDIDDATGEKVEHSRRARTKKYSKIDYESYTVNLTEDYKLTFYEYDENKNYLGSHKTFTNDGTYTPSEGAKYFKLTIKAPKENSMSEGQWVRYLSSKTAIARIYIGDVDSLAIKNKNIDVEVPYNVSAKTIQDDLFENKNQISNDLWYALVSNGIYNPNINTSKRTYYVSSYGDDNNSGLTAEYPKKTVNQFSGVSNINILLECGSTFDMKGGFTVGSGVTISSYGEGARPILSYYRELNHHFDLVEGYSNLYVTDIKDLPDYNGNKNKSDCNIGQLLIDGNVNWKRVVFESDSEFTPSKLTKNADEKSWSVDYKNAKLYIYTRENPNNFYIKYAPSVTALSSKKTNNITIKGIEIVGAGQHAINFTDTSNVVISANSFQNIGGSILTSAGIRYGNAVQIWDSATNVEVSNNIARWIFDTCYTNQGSASDMLLTNVVFKNNIGMYAQWGLETWGDGGKGFTNIEYSKNILYHMADITNPNVKMQVSSSGHLYGEASESDYISYRGGNKFQQIANLAFWCPGRSYMPDIRDNIFWGTNRFLVIGTWYNDTVDIDTLNNNLFYEDYNLSSNGIATLYKFKTTIDSETHPNRYYTAISSITSSTSNTVSTHKKTSNYNNQNEKNMMLNLINEIITK